jgi:hypothetical protein
MVRSSIWLGICAFVLGLLATADIDTSKRGIRLSNVSFGGLPALAQPAILDTLEDLGLDADDGTDDDDEGPDDGPDDGTDDDDDDDDVGKAKPKAKSKSKR